MKRFYCIHISTFKTLCVSYLRICWNKTYSLLRMREALSFTLKFLYSQKAEQHVSSPETIPPFHDRTPKTYHKYFQKVINMEIEVEHIGFFSLPWKFLKRILHFSCEVFEAGKIERTKCGILHCNCHFSNLMSHYKFMYKRIFVFLFYN